MSHHLLSKLTEQLIADRQLNELPKAVEIEKDIRSLEQEMISFFSENLHRDHIDQVFQIPDHFLEVLRVVGHKGLHYGGDYGFYVATISDIASNTKMWFDVDHHKSSVQEPWLYIGEYSDKHWNFIYCDQNSDNFGEIVDCHDNTPWNDYKMMDKEGKDTISWIWGMANYYKR